MKYLALIMILFVSGCAGSDVFIPSDSMIEGATETSHVIGDASTAKEAIVHKSIQKYYEEYGKAYKDSGFSMTMVMVDIAPGVTAYMPENIAYRERVDMIAPPAKPSEHPVWNTVNNVMDVGLRYGFGYLAVDSVVGGFKALGENAGNEFYGDTQFNGSFNTAGNDQVVTTGTMNQHTDNCADGNCGEDLPVPTLEECLANPPAGYSESGTPMATESVSCGSLFEAVQ